MSKLIKTKGSDKDFPSRCKFVCGVCMGDIQEIAAKGKDRLYWCPRCGSLGESVNGMLPGWKAPAASYGVKA